MSLRSGPIGREGKEGKWITAKEEVLLWLSHQGRGIQQSLLKPWSWNSLLVTGHWQADRWGSQSWVLLLQWWFPWAELILNPLLAPPRHFPYLWAMQPPCHISNFKNSSYQMKQRTEMTGYLPELSPRHMGMQLCLTMMTSSQSLSLPFYLYTTLNLLYLSLIHLLSLHPCFHLPSFLIASLGFQ